jgi:hypothetical protein
MGNQNREINNNNNTAYFLSLSEPKHIDLAKHNPAR